MKNMNKQKIAYFGAIIALLASILLSFNRLFGGPGLGVLITLAICAVLCFNKKDYFLVGGLALATINGLFTIFSSYFLVGFLASFFNFGAWLATAAVALLLSEPQIIKKDLTKFADLAKKFFWVPAAIKALSALIFLFSNFIFLFSNFNEWRFLTFFIIKNFLSSLAVAAGLLFITYGLVDPYEGTTVAAWIANLFKGSSSSENKTTENGNNGAVVSNEEAYCSMGKHILLLLFTFGIWQLIWIYRVTKYLNKAPNSDYCNPTTQLLLCIFIPFYQIFWFYKHGQKIDGLSKQQGLNNSDMATLCLILGIFIPLVACILMQDRINSICTAETTATPVTVPVAPATPVAPAANPVSTTEELKNYKELLDTGVITQEEFDAKKKQLLGL